MTRTPLAVVTGGGTGIGGATARGLAQRGYRVVVAGRRADKIEAVAAEIGGRAVRSDVSNADDVARLRRAVDEEGGVLDVLVNNAGGALGLQPVASADEDQWRAMFETNVMGTVAVTKALLPALLAVAEAGAGTGIIVNVGSTAGLTSYEGGGGYCVAKHGTHVVTETLRLELYDQPVRITEIAPGMVHTDEFALTRFDGDQARADAVYAGVAEPLTAADCADAIVWMATRPAHVNVDLLVLRPRAQAAQHKVHRILT